MPYTPPIYPNAIPSVSDIPIQVDDIDDATAEFANSLSLELRAGLDTLGVNPQGDHVSVVSRLDSLDFILSSALISHNLNQPVPSGEWFTLDNDVVVYDTFSLCSDPQVYSLLSAPVKSFFSISASVLFASNPTRSRALRFFLNDLSVIASVSIPALPAGLTEVSLFLTALLAPEDQVQLQVFQDSGSDLDVVALDNVSPLFAMRRA